MTSRILATRRLPDAGWEILRKGVAVTLLAEKDDELVPRERILAAIPEADVLVSLLTETIDKEILEAGKRLRGVANMAVGFNNIDVPAATALGLPVSNTPGVLTDTTADLAFALLLAVARNLVPSDRYMREGKFKLWGPSLFLGADVSRGGDGRPKTLGIVGFGRIGQAVFRRAQGFDMRVLAFDPPLKALIDKTGGVEYADFATLLAESDFITLHTDLNPSTRHLFDERAFDSMKPNAILVNTSRGPVVDEAALVEALKEGKIAGAGLDVYEDEPRMAPGLAELENVIVLPHIASASRDTRNKMATMCAENAAAHLMGIRAPNCVNPEVYEAEAYRKRAGR
ncbi:MAG: D-glycerate dehydrogenase [Planctomycetes bacterium]|nr:D-glycerate dehydrogenase [Planctomycetota bacterium]